MLRPSRSLPIRLPYPCFNGGCARASAKEASGNFVGRAPPAIRIAVVAGSRDRDGATPMFGQPASVPARAAEFRFRLGCVPKRDPHGQISVRIPGELRAKLKRTAKSKQVSVGELIRAAIEAHAAAAGRTR